MTTARRLAVLTSVAASIALTGCGGDTCPTEVAKVTSVPASCSLAADANVTVNLPLCTSCNQSAPECVVVPPSGGPDNDFQLDTTAQACTDGSSCPLPASCPAVPPVVSCRFRTPAVSGSYDFVIIDANANVQTIPFTVSAGGALGCG
jgi:hypothetical protein